MAAKKLAHRTPKVGGVLPAPLLGVVLVSLSGCAFGNVGTVAARVERIDGAHIVDLHSFGLSLRTSAYDPGLGLGYSRRRYVFADTVPVPAGWHFWRVPLPDQLPLARDVLMLGLDGSTAEPSGGIVIGYQRTQLSATVPSGASVYLEYGAGRRLVRFHDCKLVETCDISDF